MILPRLIYDELLTPNYNKLTRDSIYSKFSIYNLENMNATGWLQGINAPNELKHYSQRIYFQELLKCKINQLKLKN